MKGYLSEKEEKKFFGSGPEETWLRCLPVWREAGRVEDLPYGIRKPRYAPSMGKRLGQEFARRYRDDYSFVIEKLGEQDPLVVLVAFDLLTMIAWEFYDHLPEGMLNIRVQIPDPASSEIRSDRSFKEFTGTTIGEFLPFLLEHG